MKTELKLRLLASTSSSKGKLFTRLVGDLFFALGYDDLRFDVQGTGREIDIKGKHRFEERRLVAECKAHAAKIGGTDLNKFYGVATRERDDNEPIPVTAYFVSLSGFRESGIEQELGTSRLKRTILMDSHHIINELIGVRILISQAQAAEKAGRCAEIAGLQKVELDGYELLGHQQGYVWVVFYAQGKHRTHFALIHAADGMPLAKSPAKEIIVADSGCAGVLNQLTYLLPSQFQPDRTLMIKAALEQYRHWVVAECGYIQLGGLPAAADLSAFRLKLEQLFVPLKISVKVKDNKNKERIQSVGQFFAANKRFSILAKPGGGKSTLLKRIAVAYADPQRMVESDDGLPAHDYLPLLLRCRELKDRARLPIRELLIGLCQNAAMSNEETHAFCCQIDEALRAGRVLLLVDGLDEISDEGSRAAFAGNLRLFLAMFPQIAMIATSREAGYRHVAGVIASACTQVSLVPFDKEDVNQLCESWHVEVVGDKESVRVDAGQLARNIWDNNRIRALAENPLMLTTLLVIRRCIGELPTRRVELYREAVKVLVRTWNTEGFDPMDLEETLAQLSYVACVMMSEGVQRVGYNKLVKLLKAARKELDSELQFTQISAQGFIERIEYRSSLLMQVGHERIDDELQPVYEFRHLTFQEYLAARGLVEEEYPGRDEGECLLELLKPHIDDERWFEVIPLSAVLANRKAQPLLEWMTLKLEGLKKALDYQPDFSDIFSLVLLQRQCLLDEVKLSPAMLYRALKQAARFSLVPESKTKQLGIDGNINYLLRGKFKETLISVIEEAYLGAAPDWDEYYPAMMNIAAESVSSRASLLYYTVNNCENLKIGLNSEEVIEQIRAAFICGSIIPNIDNELWGNSYTHYTHWHLFDPLKKTVETFLSSENIPLILAACYAMGNIGQLRDSEGGGQMHITLALFNLWSGAESSVLRKTAGSVFGLQPLSPRDTFNLKNWREAEHIFEKMESEKLNTLILAWYCKKPWTDDELAKKIASMIVSSKEIQYQKGYYMLLQLGASGEKVLKGLSYKYFM